MDMQLQDDLIKKSQELDASPQTKLFDPEVPQAKKRGRPRKDEPQKENLKKPETPRTDFINKVPTKVLCLPITKVISSAGVAVVGDKRAEMNDTEIDSISDGMALVFDKYLPALLGNYGAEIALITALGGYATRLAILNKQIKIEKVKINEILNHAEVKAQEIKNDQGLV